MDKVALIRNKLFFVTSIILVFILPYSIIGTSAAIILLLISWIAEGQWQKKINRIKSNYLFFVFISVFLIQLIGLLYTENQTKGSSEIEKKLSLFIFPLLYASCTTLNKKRTERILLGFVLSCLLAVCVCFANAIIKTINYSIKEKSINWDLITIDEFNRNYVNYSHKWDAFSYMEFTSAIDIHPTYLSIYLLFSILIIIYLKSTSQLKKSLSVLYSTILCLFLFVIILLTARIVILTTFVLFVFYIFYYFSKKNQLAKTIIYVLTFSIVLAGLIYSIPFTKYRLVDQISLENIKFPDHHDKWNSTNLRIAQWYCSFETFKAHPLLGVGTGDSQDFLQNCYQTLDLGPFYKIYNSHNQYLQIATSSGSIGLLLFILCLVLPIRKKISPLYLGFIFIIALSCITESLLQNQKGIVFYSLFNSLLAFHLPNRSVGKQVISDGKEVQYI